MNKSFAEIYQDNIDPEIVEYNKRQKERKEKLEAIRLRAQTALSMNNLGIDYRGLYEDIAFLFTFIDESDANFDAADKIIGNLLKYQQCEYCLRKKSVSELNYDPDAYEYWCKDREECKSHDDTRVELLLKGLKKSYRQDGDGSYDIHGNVEITGWRCVICGEKWQKQSTEEKHLPTCVVSNSFVQKAFEESTN